MRDVEILPPAQDDFDEGYVWYRKRDQRAADGFDVSINAAIEKIRSDPTLGIRLDDEHFFYRLKKSYPYYLVYRVEPTKIIIVAISHYRRDPGYWRGR